MAKDTEAEREEGETRCCVSTWLYYFEYILSIIGMFLLLVAAIALVLFWCIFYRKGYNTWKSDKEAQFNLHPTLMVFGICFNAFAIVLYRLGRCSCKLYIKLLHGFFNLLAVACYMVGLFSIFEYHQMSDTAHFMSLHSWVGLATLGLLLTQFFFGFKTYILLMCCERATTCYRACMTPLHTAFGFTIFMLAIATAISGLVQKSIITLGEGAILSEKPEEMQEQAVLNCLGVTLVCLAVVVTYIIARRRCRVTSDTFVSESHAVDNAALAKLSEVTGIQPCCGSKKTPCSCPSPCGNLKWLSNKCFLTPTPPPKCKICCWDPCRCKMRCNKCKSPSDDFCNCSVSGEIIKKYMTRLIQCRDKCNICKVDPCECMFKCGTCYTNPCGCNKKLTATCNDQCNPKLKCSTCGYKPCKCQPKCINCHKNPCKCKLKCATCRFKPCQCNLCTLCGYRPCRCNTKCARCWYNPCRCKQKCGVCKYGFCQCNQKCTVCSVNPCKCIKCTACGFRPCQCNIKCGVCSVNPCRCKQKCSVCEYDSCKCNPTCNICSANPCKCIKCSACGFRPCQCKIKCGVCSCKPCRCKIRCTTCNYSPCRCKPRCTCGCFPCRCTQKCSICCTNPCKCKCTACSKCPCECKAKCTACYNNPCQCQGRNIRSNVADISAKNIMNLDYLQEGSPTAFCDIMEENKDFTESATSRMFQLKCNCPKCTTSPLMAVVGCSNCCQPACSQVLADTSGVPNEFPYPHKLTFFGGESGLHIKNRKSIKKLNKFMDYLASGKPPCNNFNNIKSEFAKEFVCNTCSSKCCDPEPYGLILPNAPKPPCENSKCPVCEPVPSCCCRRPPNCAYRQYYLDPCSGKIKSFKLNVKHTCKGTKIKCHGCKKACKKLPCKKCTGGPCIPYGNMILAEQKSCCCPKKSCCVKSCGQPSSLCAAMSCQCKVKCTACGFNPCKCKINCTLCGYQPCRCRPKCNVVNCNSCGCQQKCTMSNYSTCREQDSMSSKSASSKPGNNREGSHINKDHSYPTAKYHDEHSLEQNRSNSRQDTQEMHPAPECNLEPEQASTSGHQESQNNPNSSQSNKKTESEPSNAESKENCSCPSMCNECNCCGCNPDPNCHCNKCNIHPQKSDQITQYPKKEYPEDVEEKGIKEPQKVTKWETEDSETETDNTEKETPCEDWEEPSFPAPQRKPLRGCISESSLDIIGLMRKRHEAIKQKTRACVKNLFQNMNVRNNLRSRNSNINKFNLNQGFFSVRNAEVNTSGNQRVEFINKSRFKEKNIDLSSDSLNTVESAIGRWVQNSRGHWKKVESIPGQWQLMNLKSYSEESDQNGSQDTENTKCSSIVKEYIFNRKPSRASSS